MAGMLPEGDVYMRDDPSHEGMLGPNYATIPPQPPSMLDRFGQWNDKRKASRAQYWADTEAAAARRAEAHRAQAARPNLALKHLLDIFLRGKKPSRDESTWGDRTGAEDEAYEKEMRREESLKAHRTKAGFIGTRG